MKFDQEAYEKLFPRKKTEPTKTETAVEGFNPSQDEVEETTKESETVEVESEVTDGGNGADNSDDN